MSTIMQPRCNGYCGEPLPASGFYFQVIWPSGMFTRFCDSDCLREYLERMENAFMERERASLATLDPETGQPRGAGGD